MFMYDIPLCYVCYVNYSEAVQSVIHSCDDFLVNDQLDAFFPMYLFHACTCFEQQVLIIRRVKLCLYIKW